jgi:hypothetical protein
VSYDIWLTIDTGGPEPAAIGGDWNFTSNAARTWRAAGADLAEFAGRLAGDCVPTLAAAIAELECNASKYRQMDPPNGWGKYDDLLPALRTLLDLFRAHPKATVVVYR